MWRLTCAASAVRSTFATPPGDLVRVFQAGKPVRRGQEERGTPQCHRIGQGHECFDMTGEQEHRRGQQTACVKAKTSSRRAQMIGEKFGKINGIA